ncbi:hypothetical protein Lser_V15G43682 [Lactuca serriola]
MTNTRSKIKKTHNTKNNRSAALIDSNDDVLIEILLRLPVTSVLRFKSVSKHCRSLLSDPRFTLLYKKSSISPGFFCYNMYIRFDGENPTYPATPPRCNLDFYPDPCGIKILQSCNGLMLCCSKRGSQRDRKYYVFNPTTRQFVIIPSVPGGKDVRKNIRFMGLAFDRTDCVHFKVVCVNLAKPKEDLFQIQIYSSETRKWKISDESISAPHNTYFFYGVYWNQVIHWVPNTFKLSCFKLDTEEFTPLPLTVSDASCGGYKFGYMPIYFGESRGHLHLADTPDGSRNHLQLNVYEMLKDHSGWFLKYRVELVEFLNAYPEMIRINPDPSIPIYYDYQLLDVVRGEEEDETFFVIQIPGNRIIRYNVADKSFKQVFDTSHFYSGPIGFEEIHPYVETIVSL